MVPSRSTRLAATILTICLWPLVLFSETSDETSRDVLSTLDGGRLDVALERALHWLCGQQEADGSFPSPSETQPAITSLSVLAMLSAGHLPGHGPYGDQIDLALDFVLSCQRKDGLLTELVRAPVGDHASGAPMYNHGISGVMLCELYGMADSKMHPRLSRAIDKALAFTASRQDRPNSYGRNKGGWGYLDNKDGRRSDLSVTSWQLMFYRSARNAGFQVPAERIDKVMRFVVACFDPEERQFCYVPGGPHSRRGMNGAGIFALAHAGQLDEEMAELAGDWLLAHPYGGYAAHAGTAGREYYGLFFTVPAMYMLGGRHWREFFPSLVKTMLTDQRANGSWPPERGDEILGPVYSTALIVAALNMPNQLLPIVQR